MELVEKSNQVMRRIVTDSAEGRVRLDRRSDDAMWQELGYANATAAAEALKQMRQLNTDMYQAIDDFFKLPDSAFYFKTIDAGLSFNTPSAKAYRALRQATRKYCVLMLK